MEKQALPRDLSNISLADVCVSAHNMLSADFGFVSWIDNAHTNQFLHVEDSRCSS